MKKTEYQLEFISYIVMFFLLNAYILCIFWLYEFYYSDNKHLYFLLSVILLLFYIFWP